MKRFYRWFDVLLFFFFIIVSVFHCRRSSDSFPHNNCRGLRIAFFIGSRLDSIYGKAELSALITIDNPFPLTVQIVARVSLITARRWLIRSKAPPLHGCQSNRTAFLRRALPSSAFRVEQKISFAPMPLAVTKVDKQFKRQTVVWPKSMEGRAKTQQTRI